VWERDGDSNYVYPRINEGDWEGQKGRVVNAFAKNNPKTTAKYWDYVLQPCLLVKRQVIHFFISDTRCR
jgi:hypothetical protein